MKTAIGRSHAKQLVQTLLLGRAGLDASGQLLMVAGEHRLLSQQQGDPTAHLQSLKVGFCFVKNVKDKKSKPDFIESFYKSITSFYHQQKKSCQFFHFLPPFCSSSRLCSFINDHHIKLQALGICCPATPHLSMKDCCPGASGEDHLTKRIHSALSF